MIPQLQLAANAYIESGRKKEKEMARLAKRFRLIAVTALIALSLSAFAGTAAAATGPAPGTGLVGACNMVHALNVGPNGGLYGAWVLENANGWDGKWVAVATSGCPFEKFPQPQPQP